MSEVIAVTDPSAVAPAQPVPVAEVPVEVPAPSKYLLRIDYALEGIDDVVAREYAQTVQDALQESVVQAMFEPGITPVITLKEVFTKKAPRLLEL